LMDGDFLSWTFQNLIGTRLGLPRPAAAASK
jgi:hypothetical protein